MLKLVLIVSYNGCHGLRDYPDSDLLVVHGTRGRECVGGGDDPPPLEAKKEDTDAEGFLIFPRGCNLTLTFCHPCLLYTSPSPRD